MGAVRLSNDLRILGLLIGALPVIPR